VALLDRRAETFEEAVLRPVMHHEIRTRNQELCRDRDRACISDHAICRLIERQQDVDGDRSRDERVGIKGLDALGIVSKEMRLDVRVDEEVSAQLLHDLQSAAGEGHIEFDPKGRRGEHHASNVRRVIVCPCRDEHRAKALGDYRDVLLPNAVGGLDVIDKRLDVAHRRANARAKSAFAWRAALSARIPREDGEVRKV